MTDITLRRDCEGEFYFQPHSARGDQFLAHEFATIARDLSLADMLAMAKRARLRGLVVVDQDRP